MGWILAAGACAPAATPSQRVFEKTCSRCHDPGVALGQRFDRSLWKAVVKRMSDHSVERFSRPIPENDQETIVDYLVDSAGKR